MATLSSLGRQRAASAPVAGDWFDQNAPPGDVRGAGMTGNRGTTAPVSQPTAAQTPVMGEQSSINGISQGGWGGQGPDNFDANGPVGGGMPSQGGQDPSGYYNGITDPGFRQSMQGGGGQDPLALIRELQGQLTPGPEGVNQILQRLNAAGIPAVRATHAGGQPSGDKIVLPDGRMLDLGSSLEEPGGSWGITHDTNTDPNSQVIDVNGTLGTFGNYLQQHNLGTPQYGYLAQNDPGLTTNPQSPLYQGGGRLDPGNLSQGWREEFQVPTGEDVRNTPGYQFALGEGLKGVQSSAAARGTLLTGGTLKALNNYAQNYADTRYQQARDNAANDYMRNYGIFQNNTDTRFNRLNTLAQRGLQAAGLQGTAAQNNADRSSDLLTDQGNAAAAGTVGTGNAILSGIGGIGNTVADYLARRRRGMGGLQSNPNGPLIMT